MKTFVQTLYDYNFERTVTEDNSDKEDEITIEIVSDLHHHGDQQLVGYSDIIGTVTEEDNSDVEDEMEIHAYVDSNSFHGNRCCCLATSFGR